MQRFLQLFILALFVGFVSGCAFNRPNYSETIINPTNGVTTIRRLSVPTWALWPATTELGKQRVSIGKTISVGTFQLTEDGGATNMVEALKAIDSILGKIR